MYQQRTLDSPSDDQSNASTITSPETAACSPGTSTCASDAEDREYAPLSSGRPCRPIFYRRSRRAARALTPCRIRSETTFTFVLSAVVAKSTVKQSTLVDAVRASVPKAQAKVDNHELRQPSGLGPPHWLGGGGGVSTSGADRGPLTRVRARPASYIDLLSASLTLSLNTALVASNASSFIASRRPICSRRSSTRRVVVRLRHISQESPGRDRPALTQDLTDDASTL